jgi:Mg2+ and Co2+ transporter CorA
MLMSCQQTVKETSAANLLNNKSELGLEEIYRLVQMVLWLREGLEASLQAIEQFMVHYQEGTFPTVDPESHMILLAELTHRREMFRSTQLRLNSLHQRLDSVTQIVCVSPREAEKGLLADLETQAYNLAGLRDNRVMHRTSEYTRAISEAMSRDSSKMATIAWIGVIFLPTSIVASVISAIYGQGDSAGKSASILGILLAVSIPLTIVLIFAYHKLTEPRIRRGF